MESGMGHNMSVRQTGKLAEMSFNMLSNPMDKDQSLVYVQRGDKFDY